jgi:O-antigen/teichoic acid export membrane protein
MLAFGVAYTASQRAWQLRALINPLVVGRFVGAEGVAFVSLAIRIAEGLGFLRQAASRLAIASLSRLQHDANLLRSSLQKALRGQVIILGPLLDAFALASPFVIHHFLTDRWAPVQHIYPLVALAVLINSIYNLQAAALFVAGRQWIILFAYVCHVALFAAGAFVLVPRTGLLGYGLADLLACAAYPLLQIRTSKTIGTMPHTLWMWVLVFGLPLFAPYAGIVWSIALFALAVLLGALVWWMERNAARNHDATSIPEMNRVLVRG